MKKTAFALLALVFATTLFAAPRTYNVTSDGKNYAMFSSEATLETVHGRTTKVSGTIDADPADVSRAALPQDLPSAQIRLHDTDPGRSA